ncbi:MAG: hypothetical protein RLZZ584_2482 [Pseudomonadota bacterium]|jgi:hypothetical protein
MSRALLEKEYVAEAAVSAYRIVKAGTTDDLVSTATSSTDKTIGVIEGVAPASGERCTVVMDGLADVTYGGTVTRGDLVTSDATGRAVTAAPATGVNARVIGVARLSGVAGDIGEILIVPSMVQG